MNENKFIEVTFLNAQNDRVKTKAWLRADQILQVITPTEQDLARHKEMGAIIMVNGGQCYSIEETPEYMMEELGQPIDER